MPTQTIPVHGWSSVIGELHTSHTLESEVEAIPRSAGYQTSLIVGGTGQGTTTALDIELRDLCRYGTETSNGMLVREFGPEYDLESVDTILDELLSLTNPQPSVLVLRDMWALFPSTYGSRETKPVERSILENLTTLLKRHQHYNIHVLADVQTIGELPELVASAFSRYVVFNARKSEVKSICTCTGTDDWSNFWNTLSKQYGVASIVCNSQPENEHTYSDFIGPVVYTSPLFPRPGARTGNGLELEHQTAD